MTKTEPLQQVDVSSAKYMQRTRMDGNRATGHSSGQFRTNNIVDKYFCPGSSYPHQKFDDKEAQGSERNNQIGTGRRRARAYHRSEFQNEI